MSQTYTLSQSIPGFKEYLCIENHLKTIGKKPTLTNITKPIYEVHSCAATDDKKETKYIFIPPMSSLLLN